ncbi:hypothetical protein ELH02_27610 (plasmid) [Rhizobium ruizarguesonis]|nr:hypothetical protein [Rhizobium leguminosarum bv. viciae]TAT91932.1 hypothetical protein ELI55_36610 [Rhizobium ruizarguesonis]NKL39803.1 hypothetical protein [Rhizobium leguminosarum bv. viciae]TAZ26583.1 hypothetical protein ELH74_31580 [Rhizobium ruizarguesonis]TBA11893.1 hypothetical protein ELH66_27715 [Rhizobium ruizarguesonis]
MRKRHTLCACGVTVRPACFARNGIAVCGLLLEHAELVPPPADVKEGRYFHYRRT